MWLRWATQQIRTAVAYELVAADPTRGPHLSRLPLHIDERHGPGEVFLRQRIRHHAQHRPQADPVRRVAQISAAILAEPGVQIAEPDLQTMLAWQLAKHCPVEVPGQPAHWADDDHECFDPEQLAAELVASGVVAPAWKLREITGRYRELVAGASLTVTTTLPRRHKSRPTAPGQLALLYPA